MNSFSVDNELAVFLIKNGLVETTSIQLKSRGKRIFGTHQASKKKICFDGPNFIVINSPYEDDFRTGSITRDELKLVLFFLKVNGSDYKTLQFSDVFNFRKAGDEIIGLRNELTLLQDSGLKIHQQKKIKKILTFYDNLLCE